MLSYSLAQRYTVGHGTTRAYACQLHTTSTLLCKIVRWKLYHRITMNKFMQSFFKREKKYSVQKEGRESRGTLEKFVIEFMIGYNRWK